MFRQADYPIGSGTVESVCKVVVQQRLKQAGMRWSRYGAQAVFALRFSANLGSSPDNYSPLQGLPIFWDTTLPRRVAYDKTSETGIRHGLIASCMSLAAGRE